MAKFGLDQLGACRDAVAWADSYDTLQEAWKACERGDWLLWYVGKTTTDRKKLVATACQCARLALPYVKAGELRPLRAIETAEKWTRGEATIEEVRKAATYAYAAAAYAYAYAASAAAAAAAASAAADAAYAAAAAAAYAADAAAKQSTFKQCADIVRTMYPEIGTV